MSILVMHKHLSCHFPSNLCRKNLNPALLYSRASCKCDFTKNNGTSESVRSFSILKRDSKVDIGSVWSSMGFYVFSIHVPLSFGGLSAAANILHQPVLNAQLEAKPVNVDDTLSFPVPAQAFLILGIQTLELCIVFLLLNCPGKPQYNLRDFFHDHKFSNQRSWLLASVLGFGFLLSVVFISYCADGLIGSKDVSNPFLKEILCSGPSSLIACILVYCVVTPLLEEVVYRGFFVTSLASKMKWVQAVAISSIVFSASHFSGENFFQLFIVGFVLGCSYCWSGNLSTSIAIHSLYNALVLFLAYVS